MRWMFTKAIVVLFHDVCKSNHYAVQVKSAQYCISIMSQETRQQKMK